MAALRRAGVTDADLDIGYARLDYTRSGQWGGREGAGDCFIDEREVVEYAAERWRDYRIPVERWYGRKINWDFDDQGYNPDLCGFFACSCLSLVPSAVVEIKEDLLLSGLVEGTDPYREAMAKGIFYLYEFPLAKDWRIYDAAQRQNVLSEIGMPSGAGFNRLDRFLEENGGCGRIYDRYYENFLTYNVNSIASEYEYFAGIELYSMFDTAGLRPVFMELTGFQPPHYRCQQKIPVRLGVGLELSGGWSVFDPVLHNSDFSGSLAYPLTHGQLLAGMKQARESRSLYVSGGRGLAPDHRLLGYGYLPLIGAFHAAGCDFDAILAGRGLEGDCAGFIEALKRQPDNVHPFFYSMMGVGNNGMDSSPAFADQRAFFHYVSLVTSFAARGDRDAILKHSDAVLESDPDCPFANFVKASSGSNGGGKIDFRRIERRFERASDLIPSDHPYSIYLNHDWGLAYYHRGSFARARRKLTAAVEAPADCFSAKPVAGFFLACMEANDSRFGAAEARIKSAFEALSEYLSSDGRDEDGSLSVFDGIREHLKTCRLSAETFEQSRFLQGAFEFLSLLGRRLLRDGHHSEALQVLEIASAIPPAGKQNQALMDLQEAYLQSGDLDAAEQLNERIWNIFPSPLSGEGGRHD